MEDITILIDKMGEQLSVCPLKQADYQHLAQELDSIIETLKK